MREHAVAAEPRDRRDPVALEREDEERVWPRDLGLGGREVDAERRLRVGARRHEQRRAAPERAVVQERADHVAALVLVRLRRHRQPGLVGQQGDDRVGIACLDGVGKAADDLALALGVRERRAFASGGR